MRPLLPMFLSLCAVAAATSISMADDNTQIREGSFHLELPGSWNGAHDARSGTWQYRASKSDEAVTVSLSDRAGVSAVGKVRADFDSYIEARRKTETERGLTLTQTKIETYPNSVVGTHFGADPSAKHRTFTVVIANTEVTGTFFYEAAGMTSSEFEARAIEVLGKVGLVGSK